MKIHETKKLFQSEDGGAFKSSPYSFQAKDVAIIIPAYNEEDSISLVLNDIPKLFREQVVVVNNNSSDQTAQVAQDHGAHVVLESRQGYGSACLTGIAVARKKWNPSILVFLDGDYSDYPEDIHRILTELDNDQLDLVIGSRNRGEAEEGALLPQAKFGNWLATTLLRMRYKYPFSDLGPFRAVTTKALEQIQMKDPDFGWTMEMQVKALKYGLKVSEVSVRYRKRVGISKITGTIKGSVMAGYKILFTLFRYM